MGQIKPGKRLILPLVISAHEPGEDVPGTYRGRLVATPSIVSLDSSLLLIMEWAYTVSASKEDGRLERAIKHLSGNWQCSRQYTNRCTIADTSNLKAGSQEDEVFPLSLIIFLFPHEDDLGDEYSVW